jgi:hypothetical protein
MTLTVLSKIMEIIVKSYSLTRVLNKLMNFISERGSQNITVFGLYKIIIRLNPFYNLHYQSFCDHRRSFKWIN